MTSFQLFRHGNLPFIIAEMSGNHNQSFERALKIVDAAAKAGAHALKIQTYTADTMTLNLRSNEFFIKDPKSLWKGTSLYDLYKKAYTPWEWHKPIFDRCRKKGLIGFSTPFDVTAVDFLEKLHVPLYKIASFENTDIPLIQRVAKTGKPMIISTGMATQEELDESVSAARQAGCRELILLKCTSNYPADASDSNLRTIPDMASRYKCQIGLSDHTLGIGVSISSIPFGAVAIERHFTLSRKDRGVDSAFSLEPNEMKQLVDETGMAWRSLGKVMYGPTQNEKKSLVFRRSLYVSENMKKGDVFTSRNLRCVRPGLGLPPKYYSSLLGKKIRVSALMGTPVSMKMVK